MTEATYYIGLISGTSRDGVDGALVRFEGDIPVLEQACCIPYHQHLADNLDHVVSGHKLHPASIGELDTAMGDFFAQAALHMIKLGGITNDQVTAIGSHGQTLWHQPEGAHPFTLQAGDGHRIARQTGISTVADFRRADLAVGGQGAPLAPLLHKHLFHQKGRSTAVLNLGGIANITLIEADGTIIGFDTGPSNCLLDRWCKQHLDQAYDEAGRWAATGIVNRDWLNQLLEDPYFHQPPPKSTGLEYFHMDWLKSHHLPTHLAAEDIQATLAALTAESVVAAITENTEHSPAELLVCGGGVHNTDLMERIQTLLPSTTVVSTAAKGLSPDCVESVLFAWLARERLLKRRQNTPSITGAARPVLLGTVFEP